MTAFINATTSGYGVQVYQDHDQKDQFFYVPLRAELVLGDTLKSFSVDYWGIGDEYLVGSGNKIYSAFGAILAGNASIDITSYQRKKITEQIVREFKVENPKLAPLRLRGVEISPVFADNTLDTANGGDKEFPNDLQFGSSFNYLVGTGNSLFANFVAAQGQGDDVIANPSFGINVSAKAEFRGEPWKAKVKVDLSSFWKEVRRRVAGSARFGWFKIGSAEYNKIVKELERDKVIEIAFDSGSLDLEKFGAQIFEMGKALAEAVNSGQGGDFFKLQPNRDQQDRILGIKPFGFLSSLSPWSVSINANYSEQSFTERIKFEETISYEGNFEASVPSSMVLAVVCNNSTKQYFNDLSAAEPCITSDKLQTLQNRLKKAVQKRDAEIAKLRQLLIDGKITPEVYNLLKAEIDGNSSEDLVSSDMVLLGSADIAKRGPQGKPFRKVFTIGQYAEELEKLIDKG
jgi:hypothetical protein